MLNVEEFLGTQISGANSTKVILIPPGNDYVGTIAADGVGLADFKYKQGERAGQTGYRMTVKWELDDHDGSIEKQIGRKPTITQSIMLDITDEGGLDMGEGKNVQLGRLREALGQNDDGAPWQPAMLYGGRARLDIQHRIDNNGDEQQEVKGVAKLA